MKKLFILLLAAGMFAAGACGAEKQKSPWKLDVSINRQRAVFRIGETVRFRFLLKDEKGKARSGVPLKIELWFDGRYVSRKVKTDKKGMIQVNIKPEKQCLVRCRAEYSSKVFAVGSATVSRAPNFGTLPNKRR